MKNLLYLSLIVLAMGCQSESLDIRAPYRIRLQVVGPAANAALRVHQTYAVGLNLLTDSYYSKYGYKLLYYQQAGLGRLEWDNAVEHRDILQRVPTDLPLGASTWWFTPEATGTCQVVLVAQQERGYTQPDTVRFNFQIVP